MTAPHFHCTACGHRFGAETTGPGERPRCPACMRRSSVVEGDARSRATSTGRRRRMLAVALALVGLGAAGAAAATWLWPTPDETPTEQTPAASLPETAGLDARELGWHATLLERAGAADAARALFGEGRRPQPGHAARFLAHFLQEQIAQGRLYLVEEQPGTRRRAPLAPEVLADGTLEALVAGEGAYLYPLELTMLVSALATELGVGHDLVLLEPEEPTSRRLPVVAVRFSPERADAEPLALDPRRGTLRPARDAVGHGARLLWGEHALMQARRALARGDAAGVVEPLARAERLVPQLWTVRAARVELALLQGELDAARQHVAGLAAAGDHPLAWLLEARVELAGAPEVEREQLHIERLRAIVDAFAFEAPLCVELGQRLAALGRYAEARDAFELALYRDPGAHGAHTGLARLFTASDPERAHQHLRQELGLHPDHAPAWLALGALHVMYGNPGDAERARTQGRAAAEDAAAFDQAWQALLP